jgi:head-tail adaptor
MRRHLVALERRIQSPDGTVGLTETYAVVGQAWATVGAVAPAINLDAVQVQDGVTHRLVFRWVDPSTFTHIAAKGGAQRFRVRGTRDPDGLQRWIEVSAEEEISEVVA